MPTRVCRDEDDDLVLATAVTAGADRIVTGDQDLLVLRACEGVRLLSPRRFLEWLDESETAKSAGVAETVEIPDDDALVRRLRTGSRQARRRKGRFVD